MCHAVDVRHVAANVLNPASAPAGLVNASDQWGLSSARSYFFASGFQFVSDSASLRENRTPPDARRLYHETWSAGALRRPLWGLITISTS